MDGDGTRDQTFDKPTDEEGGENNNQMKQPLPIDEGTDRRRRLLVHRCTPEQQTRLEAAFRESAVASAELKASLSQELGMTPMQVKFWFQNRRYRMKNKKVKVSTSELLQENEMLMRENSVLKTTVNNFICINCARCFLQPVSLESQRLLMENAYLLKELDKIKSYLELLTQMPRNPSSSCSFPGSVDSHHV